MFDQQSSPQQGQQGVSVNAQQGPGRVYTMPERFMPDAAHAPASGAGGTAGGAGKAGKIFSGKRKWIIIAGIILLGILGAALAATLVLQRSATPTTPVTNTPSTGAKNTNSATNSANKNGNTNQAKNSNANTAPSLDGNVNEALGTNINSQLFPKNSNTNTVAGNTNAATDGTTSEPDHSTVVDSKDKDKDGLTDEEEVLYGTTSTLPDTDTDGYVDGTEVEHGYSPLAAQDSLLESGLVLKYKQKQFGWAIEYPADWLADAANETNKELFFTSDTVEGEFIQVVFTENAKKQTAAEWYAALYDDVDEDELQAVTVDGLDGIVSDDGFSYYLTTPDRAYVIALVYNFGTKTEVHFRSTFVMMVNSFTYTAPKESSTTNANTNVNTNASTNVNAQTNSST